MSVFVISLDSAIERRQHIDAEFKKYLVDFHFYDAITLMCAEKTGGFNLVN
ncbi:glycosyltransferase family 25 protein [Acinetobacter genomosp. 15BJ]|uniref:glycosyltransferase family 25 protein n=1 Tax=Acinetobacter genomosp. 15BJ TaxID=106651 RepID=UPI003F68A543